MLHVCCLTDYAWDPIIMAYIICVSPLGYVNLKLDHIIKKKVLVWAWKRKMEAWKREYSFQRWTVTLFKYHFLVWLHYRGSIQKVWKVEQKYNGSPKERKKKIELRMIELEPFAIDGTYSRALMWDKHVVSTLISFFHNEWAFPWWRKFGRSRDLPSHMFSNSEDKVPFFLWSEVCADRDQLRSGRVVT